MEKALAAIKILDSQAEYSIMPRMWMLHNKVGVNEYFQSEIRSIGTIPMYQQVTANQMARQLSLATNIFGQLI